MQDTATPQADGYFGEDMKVDVGDYSLDALDAEEPSADTVADQPVEREGEEE